MQQGERAQKLVRVREISESEYETFRQARAHIQRYSVQNPYAIVETSYRQYRERFDQHARTHASPPPGQILNVDAVQHDLTVSILGLLSMMRLFLDHTAAYLPRQYGKQSTQLDAYDKARRREFDEHFSFRFAYKLRDYCQHVGLPIGRLVASSEQVEGRVRSTLSIQFDRDSLLGGFDNWTHARTGLEQMPPFFEINPLLDDAMECYGRIALDVAKAEAPALVRSAQTIMEIVRDAWDMPRLDAVFIAGPLVPTGKPNEQKFQRDFVPEDLMLLLLRRSRSEGRNAPNSSL